jgi:hypothetical protein
MRPALPLVALLAVACASPGVGLDRYHGAYTTHFDGVPDQAAVCAVISNHGEEQVDWVRLRLRAYSHLGERPGRWSSDWIWRGRLAPGGSAVIALVDPPVAEELDLVIRASGRGEARGRGRRVERASRCSGEQLAEQLGTELAQRTAEGIELHMAARRGDPESAVLLADER